MSAADTAREDGDALAEAKTALRGEAEARRRALSTETARCLSLRAQRRAMELPEFQAARSVCCYLPMRGEPDTLEIIAACRERGIAVCVPARREDGSYGLARLGPGARVVRGPLGVNEPEVRRWVPAGEVDVAFLPGVAFDARGGRLGRGGGHIDRLLSVAEESGGCFAVGLAFDCQVFERVPVGGHDRRMNAVVTESGTMRSQAPLTKGR